MANNVTQAEPAVEYPAPPDALQIAKDYEPGDADKKTLTVSRTPVYLIQGVEAISRDGGGSFERITGALVEHGLVELGKLQGVTECRDARHTLLLRSEDWQIRLWLQQVVPIDERHANLGHTRYVVRLTVGLHRQLGQLAAVLGLHKGQTFTLALTAALIGSPYVPMAEANQSMYEMLIELRERCRARARHAEALLRELPQEPSKQPRWTIHHVLGK